MLTTTSQGRGWWLFGLAYGLSVLIAIAAVQAEEPVTPAGDVETPARIEVWPAELKLSGTRERARIVVTGFYAGDLIRDLTHHAEYQTSNDAVVAIEGGIATPRGDGSAEITVRVGGHEAKIATAVSGQTAPQRVSFEYGALVALSKNGCNAGACHGSPSGKGGFRLSLRAFDPELDKLTLIHEDYGRRVNTLHPEESLLLLKPLMKVPHGGGMKLRDNDPGYQVLRDWIAEGCQVDPADQPRCVKLEVYPPSGRVLKEPAYRQQLAVRAHFSDGSVRDVTDLAVYSSSDEAVASISEDGLVTGHDRGEAAIIVRYLEFIESSFITFVRDVEGYAWNDPPTNNYIDEAVHAKLRQLKFLPSDLCSDEEFARRVYLDVVGVLPTVEQAQAFLSDSAPDKRAKLIDQLLDRPEYAKFWALKWGDLLRLTSKQVGDDGVYKYHRWVERAIAANMPYDEFARELLTASGSTHANPAANFYRTAVDTNDCVESISQVFLGARLQCAKCHNHPFERWTQDNYYGMAAFFNRIQRQKTTRPDEMFIWVSRAGEVTQPRTGQQMKPWLPGAGDLDQPNVDDRRDLFADWLTQKDNPYFARIEANRIWSHLFGRGIVDPPDDFRESNPPSNAELLDSLSADFVDSGYDRKHLIQVILNSRAYQASFEPNEFNKDDDKYFSHFQPRLLSGEQLLDAICQVTGLPEKFGTLPPTVKATQLPAPDLAKNEFLKIFGQPERQTVCQCERSTESNLGMAIQMFNGPLLYNKLRDEKNRFRQLLTQNKTDEQIISELHLASVSRPPTPEELRASVSHIASKDALIAEQNTEFQKQIDALATTIADTREKTRSQLARTRLETMPEPIRDDLRTALAAAEGQRTEVQKYLVVKLGPLLAVSEDDVTKALDEKAAEAIGAATAKIAELEKQKQAPGSRRVEALEDVCWALLNTNEFLFQH